MSNKTSVKPALQDSEPDPPAVSAVQARGKLMTAVRMGDAAGEVTARRQMAEARLASYIEKAVASAPPLTAGQVERLSAVLRAGGQR